MTIIKSLVYPLPALTLTQKECTSIMAPVKKAGLNAMHISRSYLNDLAFGSKEELGLGITELYTKQGVIHAYYLEKYLDTDTLTGKFLRCEIEAATLELGIGGNIFDYDYNKYSPLLTDSWVKNTWEFFHLHKITFKQQVTAKLKKEREGDIFIMERIVEQGQLKPTELNEVNRCRQHLQVNTLADIGDGYGEYLTSTYKCNKDTTRETQYNLPTQPRPGIKAIRSWKRNIKRHFLNDENKLVDELGRWYKRPEKWTWYVGLQEPHHIYEIRANGRIRTWIRENNYGPHARRKVYIYWTDAVHMSQNIAPATIIRRPNQRIKLTGYAETNNREFCHFKIPILGDTSLLEYASVPNMETTQQIIAAITARILLIISDGSHYDEIKLGAASWLIDNGNTILARGSSRTPGEKNVQGSYRSELHGILSGILHICKTLRFYPNVTGKVKYGCDGKGAVSAINDRYTITEINRKNADIITAIWKLTNASPIEWEFYHLHGHQDDNVSFQDLPRDAQLNVLADAAAKQHCNLLMENQQHTTAYTPWLPYQRHRTHHYGKLISGEYKETIRTTIQSKRARQYWINKYDFTEEHTIQIDWDLRQRSLQTFPRHKHCWLGKWCSGFCRTSRQNKRYGYQDNTKCPRCPCEMENTTHIIKCPSNDNNEMWEAEMNDLHVWMKEQDSSPEIIWWLLQALDKWRKDEEIELPSTLDDQLHTILEQQHSIGWKEMMEGYWHKGWRLIQERYWDRKRSKKSPLVWASKLQQRIWYTLWRIWDLRNKIKHGDKEQEHSQERQDLQVAIEQQWEIGISTLPPRYGFLFHGTIEDRLTDTTGNQHKWLASVWSARDFHDGFAKCLWDKIWQQRDSIAGDEDLYRMQTPTTNKKEL